MLPVTSQLMRTSTDTAPAVVGQDALGAAASQFEAMLLSQLLDDAMPASEGNAEWRQMAHRAVAESLAGAGTFGIARLLAPQEKL